MEKKMIIEVIKQIQNEENILERKSKMYKISGKYPIKE